MRDMAHNRTNARALPTSEPGEFERIDPDAPARRLAAHTDRVSFVLSDNPRWIAGTDQAQAKYAVATAIRAKYPDGVWLYHRRITGGPVDGSIDILAITHTGVWMIEVVDVQGSSLQFPGGQGPRRRAKSESFVVDGDDYTEVLTEIDRKARCVTEGLAQARHNDLPVQQVFCLFGATTPSASATQVNNCFVATLPQLVKLMKVGQSRLTPAEIGTLGLGLGERFRRPRRH